MKMSKETEQQVMEFQSLQAQLQSVMISRQQVQAQMEELGEAGEELKKSKGSVFRSIGTLLIQSSRDEAEKDVSEKKEILEVRLNTLGRQEEKIKSRLTDLKQQLEQAFGDQGGAG